MRNTHRNTVALVTLLGLAAPARAEPVSHPAGWELGLMAGAPTGVSARDWLGRTTAWDFGVGVGPGFRLHGDLLWGLAQTTPGGAPLVLGLDLGVGPVVGLARGFCGDGVHPEGACDGRGFVGVRVPLDVDARLRRAPVTFGLEVAPGLAVAPDFASGLLDAFLYVRFLL